MANINFIVPLVVYPFDIMISMEQSDEQFLKSCEGYGFNKSDLDGFLGMSSSCDGRCAMFPSGQTIIRFPYWYGYSKMSGIIAHEVFHAVTMILEFIGMDMKVGTSCEAYAYLTQYVIEKVYKGLYED